MRANSPRGSPAIFTAAADRKRRVSRLVEGLGREDVSQRQPRRCSRALVFRACERALPLQPLTVKCESPSRSGTRLWECVNISHSGVMSTKPEFTPLPALTPHIPVLSLGKLTYAAFFFCTFYLKVNLLGAVFTFIFFETYSMRCRSPVRLF